MDVQENDHQESLGGWTEVEMDAPRDFQPKVTCIHRTVHVTDRMITDMWCDDNICTYIHGGISGGRTLSRS